MSDISHVGTNEDYFQLIETNENRINSSSRTSFEILERQYDFIQPKNDTITYENNSNSNIKQDNSNNKNFFSNLSENIDLKNNDTESMMNSNSKEKCIKTSENICDVSPSMMRSISSICSPSSFVSSNKTDKKERSIFDHHRSSLKGLSSTKNFSNKSNRRSTLAAFHLSDLNCQNNLVFDNINEYIQDKHIDKTISHHSINLIKENSFNSIDNINNQFSTSNSDLEEYYDKGRTKIKLSLPMKSIKNNSYDKSNENRSNRNRDREQKIKTIRSGSIQGEFTLPTNPPITVTIQPQTNIKENLSRDNCFHDDQICSPEHIINQYKQRTASDSPLKNSSTIVSYFMDLLKPSDNKLALKLFGSRKGLLKERLRQQRAGHCIIHPCSNFRFYWDLIMLTLLITNVIVLPVAIAFFSDEINSARWISFNVISDAFFLFDILVNFRTGVLRNDFIDEIILEPRLIAINYLKTWFILDLLSSLPVDYFFLLFDAGDNIGGYSIARTGRAIKVLRLVKLLSLLRLLRLSRLVRYIHQWEERHRVRYRSIELRAANFLRFLSIASMVMRILNLLALIILLAHWNGCLQFMIPMFQNFPSDCWVALNALQNAPWTEQYTVALFKALSHMLCIGYGRYPPQSYVDMWLTMLSMVIGAMCYAVTIGHVSALVQSFDTSRRLYNEKFKQVEEYMAWRKLPREMRNRISDYYEHRFQGKIFHEDNILNELSEKLRLDVINYNCRSLVSSVPFFTNADPNFVSDVVTKLQFEVFQPGDQIIHEGTIGDKMYFIQEGVVDIIKSDGQVLTTLSDGSYFGEICLLTRAKRVAGVRCVTYCNLYSLDSSQFETVLESYPLMRRTIESVAAERLNKLGKNPSIISTRHDLKLDTAALKDMINRATPQPSSDEEDEDEDEEEEGDNISLSSSLYKNKHSHFKSSLTYIHDHMNKSNDYLQYLHKKKTKKKSSFGNKKSQRTYLAAPTSTIDSTTDQYQHRIRKSLTTPLSLFRKTRSSTTVFSNQPCS
ncbi:unnamed protein product [Rotaria sordida]|uniref:Cyclic nucleotide-binding domain-containing protein n=1 Tax=Rotaria sordida TaxID=392033 RepID=A0A814XT08_9BILA|nr:unnamed protein product [Rotaria sordida]